ERRQTVPSKIKRKLCRLAVAHVTELHHQTIITRWVQATVRDLRRQGYSDPQITEIMRRRVPPPAHIAAPPVAKVVELVGRHAPPVSLRRKARERILRR